MIALRKNLLSRSLHVLLSILILQQGFTFSVLNRSVAFDVKLLETCLIEVLEWVCQEDVTLEAPWTEEIPQPQQSSEEERSESELLEDKELVPATKLSITLRISGAFSHDTFWFSANYCTRFTPPPELG